ncbi:SdrD B-like domain-containing protein, partial [Lewinella sp. W8]|uniref:SdrD B-like domain-containing protein n=1 Tax=Lewinella sp. W8 TaxID=2528208 RepID=UPI00142CDD12
MNNTIGLFSHAEQHNTFAMTSMVLRKQTLGLLFAFVVTTLLSLPVGAQGLLQENSAAASAPLEVYELSVMSESVDGARDGYLEIESSARPGDQLEFVATLNGKKIQELLTVDEAGYARYLRPQNGLYERLSIRKGGKTLLFQNELLVNTMLNMIDRSDLPEVLPDNDQPYVGKPLTDVEPLKNTGCVNNRIVNRSFENGASPWWASGGSALIGTSAQGFYVYSGSYSLELDAPGTTAGQTFSVDGGSEYCFSIYAKNHSTTGTVFIGLDFVNSGGQELSEVTQHVTRNSGYSLYTFEGVIPNDATTINLWLYRDNSTNNDSWFDLVCFEQKDGIIDGGDPPAGFTADCGSGQMVDLYASDVNCSANPQAVVNIPNSSNVYQVVAEVVYKGSNNPGNSTFVTASDGNNYLLEKITPTNSGNTSFKIYRGLIPVSAISSVSHTALSGQCTNNSTNNSGLQSLAIYAFRNVTTEVAGSGVFTDLTGYNSLASFTIPIPTDNFSRDVVLKIPFSEITLDGRYVRLNAKINGTLRATQEWTFGPAGGPCCIDILELTVTNVAGNVDQITVEVDTRNGQGPGGVNGQSYTIAGLAYVDVQCPVLSNADYGDAPASYGDICYIVGNPEVVNRQTKLGNNIDGENGSQSNNNANGDDNNGVDDEDGVVFVGGTTLTGGGTKQLTISWSSNDQEGHIFGWIDWDRNGTFDSDEIVVNNFIVGANNNRQTGTHTFTVNVPSDIGCGTSYARFTINSDVSEAGPTGLFCDTNNAAQDGEVEDYKVTLENTIDLVCEANTPDMGWVVLDNCTVTVCEGEHLTLSINPNGTNPSWTGPNGFTATGNDVSLGTMTLAKAGDYVATLNEGNGCVSSTTIHVNVNDAPDVEVNNVTVCEYEMATLSATVTPPGNYSYLWSNGATTSSITFNRAVLADAGTYTVSITDNQTNCTSEASGTLTVIQNFTSGGEIAANQEYCEPTDAAPLTSVSMPSGGTGTGPTQFLWLQTTGDCTPPTIDDMGDWVEIPGANGPTYDPGLISQTTCFIRCARYAECDLYLGESNVITITIQEAPDAMVSATDATCGESNGTITFTFSNPNNGRTNYEFSFDGGNTYQSSVSVDAGSVSYSVAAGVYSTFVRWGDDDCPVDLGTVVVNANEGPAVAIVCDDVPQQSKSIQNTVQDCNTGDLPHVFYADCLFPSATNCSNNAADLWTVDGSSSFEEFNNGTARLQMTVRNRDNTSLVMQFDVLMTGRTQAEPAGSPKTGICVGAATNDWYYYPILAGTVTGSGALSGLQLSVTNMGPALQVGTGANLKDSDAFGLSTWMNYTIISQPASGPHAAAGVQFDFNLSLDSNTLPKFGEEDDCEPICEDGSTTITALATGGTGTLTYSWSTGESTPAITVSPSTTTTYGVTVTDQNGCFSTDQIEVEVFTNFTDGGEIAGEQDNCGPFDPNALTSVSLPSGGTGNTATEYIWLQTTGDCTPPTTEDLGDWVEIPGANAPTYDPGFLTETTCFIRCARYEGCELYLGESNVITITVFDEVSVSVPNRTICEGEDATFTATVDPAGNYTYLWSNGATTPSITISNATLADEGSYGVTVTNVDNGCTASDAGHLNVRENPDVTVSTENPACGENDGSITFTYGPQDNRSNIEFSVNGGNFVTVSVNSSPYVVDGLAPGTYTLVVRWGDNSCPVTLPSVTLVDEEGPSVEAGNDEMICVGGSVTLTATAQGGTGTINYAWNNGAGNGASVTVSPTTTTTYTVTATDENGCTATDQVTVTVVPDPEVTITASGNEVCEGGTVTLTADPSGGLNCSAVVWQFRPVGGTYQNLPTTGNTLVTDAGLTPGDYEFRARLNCSGTDCNNDVSNVVTLTVFPDPEVTAVISDNVICLDETATLTATPGGGINCQDVKWQFRNGTSGSWTNLATTGNTLVTDAGLTAGTYQYRARLVCGGVDCNTAFSAPVTLVVKPDPAGTIASQTICAGDEATLTVVPTEGDAPFTFAWSNGGGTQASATFSPATTTSYDVTITDANGCDAVVSGTINVNPNPVAEAGPDQEVCDGESVSLTATASGGNAPYTFAWSNGDNTATTTFVPTASSTTNLTFTVTVTDANGCTDTDVVTVRYNTRPVITEVTSTNPTCGDDNGTITISFNDDPNRSAIEFSLDGGLTFESSVPDNSGSVTYSNLDAGSYDLRVRWGDDDCPTDIEDVELTDENAPVATASEDVEICEGSSTTISASATGGTGTLVYTWMPGNLMGPNQTVSPAVTTTYTVTVRDENGCEDTDQVIVTVNDRPTVAVDDVEICLGETGELTAVPAGGTPPFSYDWSNGDSEASISVEPTATMTFSVVITDAKGCTATASATVTVNPLPIGDASDDVTICFGESTTMTIAGREGTPPYTYSWSTGDTGTSSTVTPNTLGTTNYFVTTTDSKGCTDVDIVMVTVVPNPEVTVENQEICSGEDATLTAVGSGGTPGYTYLWSTGATTASITVSPGATTVYDVTITDAQGCTGETSGTVIVNPLPVVDAGDDVRLCLNDEVQLTASASAGTGAYTYEWSTGATTASITVSPAVTTDYTVEVTDAKGCTDTDVVRVEVLSLPDVTEVTSTNPTCGDDNGTITIFFNDDPGRTGIEFSIDGGLTYPFTSADNAGSITIENLDAGSYDLYVRWGNNECPIDLEDVNLVDENAPVVTASADVAICVGSSTTISAAATGGTGTIVYTWMPGNLTGASQNVSPAVTTTYTVTARDDNGCESTDVVTVTVNENPTVSVMDAEICLGESAQLSATVVGGTAPFTFDWSNGDSQQNISVEPTQTTTYTVVVTDANGCTGTTTVTVTVNPLPVGDASNDITICQGDDAVLTVQGFSGTPPYTFDWSNGDSGTSSTVMPTELGTTEFRVTTTDSKGCTDVDIIAVTVVPNPEVSVAPQTICVGETATLEAVASGGNGTFTYLWNTGATTASISVSPAVTTTYSVEVTSTYTSSNGPVSCTATTDVTVTVNENPVVEITTSDENDVTCATEEVILTANVTEGTPNYSYAWTVGNDNTVVSTAATLTVNPTATTTYTVVVTDANGCSDTDDVTITVDPNACASLGDFVFVDTDGNGQQGLALLEPGVESVTVNLKDENGNIIATTTTNSNGFYSFDNLVPGTYSVQFELPAGFTSFTEANQGNDATDSDADPGMNGMTQTVTLGEGETNNTLDAGVINTASLGDFVFLDRDADGQQDAGEPGIENVTVNLLLLGSPVATTTTNGAGFYQFTDLIPGLPYVVEFVSPAGFESSPANVGDDATDSDADETTGQSPVVILASGENNPTIDAGFYETASLGDFVFEDVDGDGIQDAGEPGVPNVTVNLKDENGNVIASTTTAGDGSYSFDNLVPGDYSVQFILPGGFEYTDLNEGGDEALDSDADPAMNGMTETVTLESGENNDDLDAGLYRPASLGDFVFEDTDGDGIQDAGEPGVPNVTVNLKDENGNVIASTTTAGDGSYSFDNLEPGTYSVQFVLPGGYEYTDLNEGGDEALDSDADPAMNGMTETVTLESGDNNDDLDAGLYRPASLGDFVWQDTDGDGVQDAGEPGIENVTVNLLDADGNQVATTTTDGNGFYEFTNLAPDTYRVEFVTPAGLTPSPADQGGDDATDSDALAGGVTAPIVLESGENDPTIDAGFYQTASLGDFVFLDRDADGQQDAGEPGIENVTVNLLVDGAQVATTTTDGSGFYQFTDLTPGVEYVVEFVSPAGFESSPANVGDDATDSDADETTGQSPVVILASGENNPTIDAGFYETASLGDFVFEDTDGDGIQDAGEPGVPNVTVNLKDENGNVIASTTTAGDGSYSFDNLVPGDYSVQFVLPGGFEYTDLNEGGDEALDSDADPAMNGMTETVTLESGENNDDLDAGLYRPASLGDFVFEDTDGDGIQDAGEPGVPNVTVNLKNEAGVVIGMTTTDGNGFYEFPNLEPGVYSVQFVLPGGYEYTDLNEGGDEALDSDADPAMNGMTETVTLESGDNNDDLDAGLYRPASLGDFVWQDTDGDGVQDAGEPGIENVTVNLLDADGNQVATTTTDGNGFYEFTNLAPDTYRVEFVTPAGLTPSPADQGGDDATDSDALAGGVTAPIVLESGENDPTIDAGFYQTASLGDFVFLDRDADGQQDAGEPGIENVTVNLLVDGAQVATTTTDGSGFYQFTDLTPGVEYVVEFVSPAGFESSPSNVGDDATDSDADETTGQSPVVILASGENNPTIDAGFYETASL